MGAVGPFIIVGAGIAGLAVALALRRAGFDVIVLERRLELSAEGAGIQIGPNGAHALGYLGIMSVLAAHAVEPSAISVSTIGRQRELTRLPLGPWMRERHGAPYLTVLRQNLVHALHDAAAAAGADLRFGVDVESFAETADGIDVVVRGGRVIRAAGLIGADGVWSRVRTLAFDTDEPKPTGRIAMRAVLPLAARDVTVTLAPDAHLVAYPVSPRDLNVILIARGEQRALRWSEPVAQADAARRLALFGPGAAAWIGQATHGWRQWPLVDAPRLSTYARGRVVLIGDAAHAMMPFLAQGAVMALEDSLVLGRAVADARGGVAQAFAVYSTARQARTHRVVAAAARNGRIYHLSGPMAVARNLVLSSVPGATLMRGYDWLYGGAPKVAAPQTLSSV